MLIQSNSPVLEFPDQPVLELPNQLCAVILADLRHDPGLRHLLPFVLRQNYFLSRVCDAHRRCSGNQPSMSNPKMIFSLQYSIAVAEAFSISIQQQQHFSFDCVIAFLKVQMFDRGRRGTTPPRAAPGPPGPPPAWAARPAGRGASESGRSRPFGWQVESWPSGPTPAARVPGQ